MSKNFLFAKLFSLNIVAHLFIIQIITLSVFYLPTLLLTYLQRNINTYNYSLTITDSHSSTCTLVMLILFGLVLLKFMHKPKYEINPRVFIPNFCEVGHQHPTRWMDAWLLLTFFITQSIKLCASHYHILKGTDV